MKIQKNFVQKENKTILLRFCGCLEHFVKRFKISFFIVSILLLTGEFFYFLNGTAPVADSKGPGGPLPSA